MKISNLKAGWKQLNSKRGQKVYQLCEIDTDRSYNIYDVRWVIIVDSDIIIRPIIVLEVFNNVEWHAKRISFFVVIETQWKHTN